MKDEMGIQLHTARQGWFTLGAIGVALTVISLVLLSLPSTSMFGRIVAAFYAIIGICCLIICGITVRDYWPKL